MLSQPSWLCSAQTHLGFVGCRSRSQRAGWQGRRRAEPQALAAGHRHAACSLTEHPTQSLGRASRTRNSHKQMHPLTLCQQSPARRWQRNLLGTPHPGQSSGPRSHPCKAPGQPAARPAPGRQRHRDPCTCPWPSKWQQGRAEDLARPLLPAVTDRATARPHSHWESGISRGKGLWLPAQALQKKTRASPGKTWSAHCCKSLLALAALKCFLIPGFRQSLQRGQTTHKAGTEQRKYLPAAPNACLCLASAPVSPSSLVTRSSWLLHQPLPQHPSGTPGVRDGSHPPPQVSAAPTEPGARASSSQPLGHHLCHLEGRVHSPAWLRPPPGPRPTPGSQSHQSSQHVGMAGMCLWAL